MAFEAIRMKINPLIQSENQLRNNLLEQTPIGTSMNDVVQFIKTKKNWEIDYISQEKGFVHQGRKPMETVGEKSIRVHLGEYRIFSKYYFVTDVTVYYGFNDKAELIDIWVWKVTDTL